MNAVYAAQIMAPSLAGRESLMAISSPFVPEGTSLWSSCMEEIVSSNSSSPRRTLMWSPTFKSSESLTTATQILSYQCVTLPISFSFSIKAVLADKNRPCQKYTKRIGADILTFARLPAYGGNLLFRRRRIRLWRRTELTASASSFGRTEFSAAIIKLAPSAGFEPASPR